MTYPKDYRPTMAKQNARAAELMAPVYPDIAVCILPTDGSLILVKRGEVGYWPAPQFHDDRALADAFNDRHGVTPAMRESMQMGSCFGWHVPGADPKRADSIYHAALPLVKAKRLG